LTFSICICIDKEFTDYVRISEEDSGEDQLIKLSSVTRPTSRRRKQRSRPKSSPYEEDATSVQQITDSLSVPIKPDEGIITDGCCEVPDDPNNSNSSSISHADDSFDENSNYDDVSSEISFVFETTIEYNPEEEYEKENSSGEKSESEDIPSSLTIAEEVEKVPSDFVEEEDSTDSIDISEGIVKEEVVGDGLNTDEVNLDDIENANVQSNEVNVDEESLPDDDNNNVEDDDEDYCREFSMIFDY